MSHAIGSCPLLIFFDVGEVFLHLYQPLVRIKECGYFTICVTVGCAQVVLRNAEICGDQQ